MKESFWITNITKQDITLADLGIKVVSYSTINILNPKKYPYITKDSIKKSLVDGSLFKRQGKIIVREKPPVVEKPQLITSETYLIKPKRSGVEIKEIKYEELNISDEVFAEENADLAELDRSPLLKR